MNFPSLKEKLKYAFEWLTIPFILMFFSSLPALDAQTRLMFGRYMGFWVTEKKRNLSHQKIASKIPPINRKGKATTSPMK